MSQPASQSVSRPVRPRGGRDGRRGRPWLVALLVFGLVLSYLCAWAVYSLSHTEPRYRQLAAGATATQGIEHYRVLGLTATETALSDGGDPEPAPANTVWVIAEIEVLIDHREDVIGCSLPLLGPDGRQWDTTLNGPSRSAPGYCDTDEVVPGRPYTFEAIYQIPDRYAGQLRGLVLVNKSSAEPSQVLSPAG